METKLVLHVGHRHANFTIQPRMEQFFIKCVRSNEDSTHCEPMDPVTACQAPASLQDDCPPTGTGGEIVY